MVENTTPAERSAIDARYTKLVEKKYCEKLSKSEEAEMESLAAQLSAEHAGFYEPILEKLRAMEAVAVGRKSTMKEAS